MNLNVINKEDSALYLEKKFFSDKIKITKDIAYYLVEKVNSIPYYIQFVASEIWQEVINKKKTVKKEHVDLAINSRASAK